MVPRNKKYKASTAIKNLEQFNFYQTFSDDNITIEVDRNGLAYFWSHGITKKALADWFDICDDKGKPLDINEKLLQILEDLEFYKEFEQAVSFTRAYGSCGVNHFKKGEIKGFKPKDMDLTYDVKTREFTDGKLREYTEYVTYGGIQKPFILNSKNMEFFYYMLFEEKDKTLEGRSVLEPVWDYLQGIFICAFLSPLVVAQTTGFKILHVKKKPTKSEVAEAKQTFKDMTHNLFAIVGENDVFEYMTPKNNTFIAQAVDVLFTLLAGTTGLPKEAWRGNQVGSGTGADQTTDEVGEIHKTIKNYATPYIKKSLRIIAKLNSLALPDSFKVVWRGKAELSEQDKVDLLLKKTMTISNLQLLELTNKEIRTLLEL